MGHTSIYFVESGVKINGQCYRDVLLMEDLLPEIRELFEFNIFRQDGAPAHRAREAVETPDFINPTLWNPNSPDLNSVDYKIWGCNACRKWCTKKVSDVEDLRKRIV